MPIDQSSFKKAPYYLLNTWIRNRQSIDSKRTDDPSQTCHIPPRRELVKHLFGAILRASCGRSLSLCTDIHVKRGKFTAEVLPFSE